MSDDNRGLYRKYEVKRTDGSSGPGGKHHECSYFVLDLEHDQFAIAALRAYAKACREQYPALADDVEEIIGAQQPRCTCREEACPHVSIWMPNNASEMASYLMAHSEDDDVE